ncbi:MAG: hypothetical protein WAW37_14235 [Syntrophobacteraceae bacterium]
MAKDDRIYFWSMHDPEGFPSLPNRTQSRPKSDMPQLDFPNSPGLAALQEKREKEAVDGRVAHFNSEMDKVEAGLDRMAWARGIKL